jgi:hypothetical protein
MTGVNLFLRTKGVDGPITPIQANSSGSTSNNQVEVVADMAAVETIFDSIDWARRAYSFHSLSIPTDLGVHCTGSTIQTRKQILNIDSLYLFLLVLEKTWLQSNTPRKRPTIVLIN